MAATVEATVTKWGATQEHKPAATVVIPAKGTREAAVVDGELEVTCNKAATAVVTVAVEEGGEAAGEAVADGVMGESIAVHYSRRSVTSRCSRRQNTTTQSCSNLGVLGRSHRLSIVLGDRKRSFSSV